MRMIPFLAGVDYHGLNSFTVDLLHLTTLSFFESPSQRPKSAKLEGTVDCDESPRLLRVGEETSLRCLDDIATLGRNEGK